VARNPLPDPDAVDIPRPALELVPAPAAEPGDHDAQPEEREQPGGTTADPLKLYAC
jgi:hypothetical protein